jgi:heterodisulfide reductase subunit A
MRIGVFVCQCGTNIAATVDTEAVARHALTLCDVVHATSYVYTCSEPGQKEIQRAIEEYELQGVVVAACSPRMHEPTFRRAVERAGLNRYMFEMANIREHVSWIGMDRAANTKKAKELVSMAVAKLRFNQPLFSSKVSVNKRVMVVGGGVAGIQAALDCSEGGLEVVLVERESTIGGKMAKLDKTFPTIDCSSCILGPKMVDISQRENLTLYAASEVESVSGYVGNFKVRVRRKATYVDWNLCTGCGLCTQKCPAKKVPDSFNENLAPGDPEEGYDR